MQFGGKVLLGADIFFNLKNASYSRIWLIRHHRRLKSRCRISRILLHLVFGDYLILKLLFNSQTKGSRSASPLSEVTSTTQGVPERTRKRNHARYFPSRYSLFYVIFTNWGLFGTQMTVTIVLRAVTYPLNLQTNPTYSQFIDSKAPEIWLRFQKMFRVPRSVQYKIING